MADSVYDEDRDLDSLAPDDLNNLEQKYGTGRDQAEDQATEDGADPDRLPRKGMGRKLRQHGQQKDDDEADALNQKVNDGWQKSQAADKAAEKSLYHPESGKTGASRFSFLRKRRRRLLIGGAIASTVILGAVSFFGFLSVFKLDSLVSNIDERSFARLNGNLDGRSTSYIRAYMTLRLADIDGKNGSPDFSKPNDPDNLILRAEKVSTGNPLTDWYKTMRLSSFEQDVFDKHGIKFVSVAHRVNGQIVFRPGSITLADGTKDVLPGLTKAEQKAILTGDVNKLNGTLRSFIDVKELNNNKEGRQAIKKSVHDNTHFYQVFKRRFLRKAIRNVTGVTDWRFFDTTRSKVSEKKNGIRNKIIAAAVPESTRSGKFINCLFGISDCKFSLDPENPANEAASALAGNDNVNPDETVQEKDAKTGKVVESLSPGFGSAVGIIKNLLTQATVVLQVANVTSLLDSLDRVNQALKHHDLSKGVTVARTAQAVGLYQVFETARDQILTGQVDAKEVNEFMNVLGPMSNNEAYSTVISGNSSTVASSGKVYAAAAEGPTTKADYCKPAHQKLLHENLAEANKEFTYRCPDKQIGITSGNNASALEDAYNSTIGQIAGPILDAYHSARHAPIIGGLLDLVSGVIGDVTNAIVTAAISVMGLGSTFKDVALYIAGQMNDFLGAGPIINCTSLDNCGVAPAGDYVNLAVQGGAGAGEAAGRMIGAGITNHTSKLTAQRNMAIYRADKQANQSIFERYLSLSNPDSPAAKTTFAISNTSLSSLRSKLNFGSLFDSLSSNIATIFSHKAGAAATDDGYTACNFAGIQCFDIPQQCMDLDPIGAQPLDGTNALRVFSDNGIAVGAEDRQSLGSWTTERNSQLFYQTIYSILGSYDGDTDKVAEQIYNCNLFDDAVMGSMGSAYGYTNDNGYQ